MNSAPPLLPKPRSYFHVVLLMAGWTIVPWVLLTAWLLLMTFDGDFEEAIPLVIVGGGCLTVLVIALLAGSVVQGDTAVLETGDDSNAFLRRVNVAAAWIGYFPAGRNAGVYAYRPTSLSGFFGGRIFVRLDDDLAIMVGPRMHLRRLRDRLAARPLHSSRRVTRPYAEGVPEQSPGSR